MATMKKPAKGGATKPSMLNRIYTSFDQVTNATISANRGE